MEFRNGSRVEVWCKKQVAWRLAEIISSNRNYLFVRYEYHPGSRAISAPRKVPTKMVRPLQPAVAFIESVEVGDVVEVLNLCSWNAAIILRVISEWFYLVRLLSSGEEVNVTRAIVRVHQAWGKSRGRTLGRVHGPHILGKSKNLNSFRRFKNLRYEMMSVESRTYINLKDDAREFLDDGKAEGSPLVSQRRFTRFSLNSLSSLDASSGYFHKRQATGSQSELLKLEAGHLFRPLEKEVLGKVDIVPHTKDIFGKRNMHAFHSNRYAGCLEMEREDSLGCRSYPNDYDTDASSVGSCSILDDCTNMSSAYTVKRPRQNDHVLFSDAESCSVPDDEEGKEKFSFSPKEVVTTEIHRLELHAYHRTLQALYASGPISWEQEALLTNLRLSLNISNDEHLIGVKSLISSGTGSSFS